MNSIDEVMSVMPPAARLLGREVVEFDYERGGAKLRYTAQPEFLNRHGTVQGGLLAAMLDSATALALYSVLSPELTAVTTQLNVSFVRPAKQGTLIATSRVVSRGDRDAQASGELHDSEGTLVANAVATLRIVKRTPRNEDAR
jgi:uncharacterized protein (TIGR00369 family)